MRTQIFRTKYNQKSQAVKFRYLIFILRAYQKQGYKFIQFTDVEGADYAIANGHVYNTLEDAEKDYISRNGYVDQYAYILPIHEEIDSMTDALRYERNESL